MRSEYDEKKLFELIKKGKFSDKNCFEWLGPKDKDGYGTTTYTPDKKKKTWKVHRLIFHILKHEIPEGMIICHACDNPKCFNLNHLFIGTYADNSQDRENKSRSGNNFEPGEGNISSKLNEKIVLEIRKKYSEGMRIRDLVEYFNLNQPTVSKIVHRLRWKHI